MKHETAAQDVSVELFRAETSDALSGPLVRASISAGFPSPALDFIDLSIDLNKQLIAHPSATFYGRVKGHSMKDAGIHDGDLLIVDRSMDAAHRKVVIAALDGELTVKRLLHRESQVRQLFV